MGSLCGSGTNTVTQQSGPPAQVLQNYQNLVNQATGVSSGLSGLSGPPVADWNNEQTSGIDNINQAGNAVNYFNSGLGALNTGMGTVGGALNYLPSEISGIGGAQSMIPGAQGLVGAGANTMSGALPYYGAAGNTISGALPMYGAAAGTEMSALPYYGQGASTLGGALSSYGAGLGTLGSATPYFGAGAGLVGQSTANPFTSGAINSYMSPYINNVVNATEQQFNNQNAIQANNLTSQAIMGGNAFGGDRAAVGQGVLAGQQQAAEAPVLAGLYNSGYQTAGQQAIQEQGLMQSAGSLMGSLGSGLGNIGAEYGSLGAGMTGAAQAYGNLGSGIAGVGQGIGSLASGEVGAGSALGNVGAGIAGVGSGLGSLGGITGGLAGEAGSLAGMYGSAAGVQGGLGATQAGIGSQISALGPAYASTLESLGGSQLTGGNAIQNWEQQNLSSGYQGLLNQLGVTGTQFLAPIVEGTGSLSGGTGTTTSPGPSAISQLGGLGLSGLALNQLTGGGLASGASSLLGSFGGSTAATTAANAALGGVSGGLGGLGSAAAAGGSGLLGALGGIGSGLVGGLETLGTGLVGLLKHGGRAEDEGNSTVPETRATLMEQQRQLLSGHRKAQLFPRGTRELPLPPGMDRIATSNGVFHYDPRRISASNVKNLTAQERENEILDLGSFSKREILARVRRGERPVAIVERTPNGTEVRAAAGTHVTAPHQLAQMRAAASPGHTVRIENPKETITHRLRHANGGRIGYDDGGSVDDSSDNNNPSGLGGIVGYNALARELGAGAGADQLAAGLEEGVGFADGGAPNLPTGQPLNMSALLQGSGAGIPGQYGMTFQRGPGPPGLHMGMGPPQPPGAAAPDNGLNNLLAQVQQVTRYMRPNQNQSRKGGRIAFGGAVNLPGHYDAGGSPDDSDASLPVNATLDDGTAPPGLAALQNATFGQESSYGANPSTSSAGAVGPMQVTPGTFSQYAQPGENIRNPKDNKAVGDRILANYYDKYNGDPARAAVAYYSGPGNVAPPDSPTPWVHDISRDHNGNPIKSVSSYVSDVIGRMGGDTQPGLAALPAASTPTQGLGAIPQSSPSAIGKPDPWQAVLAAGLGMMAGQSPHALSNIGQGGLAGLQNYQQQKEELRQEATTQQGAQRLAQEAAVQMQHQKNETAKIGLLQQETQANVADKQRTAKMPFPMGQTIGPMGLPVTTYGTFDASGKIVPAVVPQTPATGAPGSDAPTSPILGADAKKAIADAYVAGDTTAISGLGYGNIGAINRAGVWNEISAQLKATGAGGKDLAAAKANFTAQSAAARTTGVREANVSTAVEEAQRTFPLALEASKNLPRSAFVPWNKAVQMVQSGTSSPELARYVTALQGARTAYSQAMSRTGVNSVHAQEAADMLLQQATGPEAVVATIGQMGREMQAAKAAPEAVRQAILSRISGREPPPDATVAPPANQSPASSPQQPAGPQEGDRKQFKQGWGVFHNGQWGPAP